MNHFLCMPQVNLLVFVVAEPMTLMVAGALEETSHNSIFLLFACFCFIFLGGGDYNRV